MDAIDDANVFERSSFRVVVVLSHSEECEKKLYL